MRVRVTGGLCVYLPTGRHGLWCWGVVRSQRRDTWILFCVFHTCINTFFLLHNINSNASATLAGEDSYRVGATKTSCSGIGDVLVYIKAGEDSCRVDAMHRAGLRCLVCCAAET